MKRTVMHKSFSVTLLFSALLWLNGISTENAAARSEFEIRVFDQDTGRPIAVRMHLKDARGRVRRVPDAINYDDHFVFFHRIVLHLPTGDYSFEMDRGPEYHYRTGHFTIETGAEDSTTVHMKRFVDMKQEGWWSGDLHIERRARDIQLLMLAEDLHIGPLTTWTNRHKKTSATPNPGSEPVSFDEQAFYLPGTGRVERSGGSLLFFHTQEIPNLDLFSAEYPSSVELLKRARKFPAAHVNIDQPTSWDMPVWLASGMVHSITMATSHLGRDGVFEKKGWGRPHDETLYPSPQGFGQWIQKLYFEMLNCGLRIPPTAASGSGFVKNPVGYNRVYAYVDGELTWKKWWDALNAGRVLVTNGPLLRPSVHGRAPGHVFRGQPGASLKLAIDMKLAARDHVDYLEIIKNGQVVHVIRLDEWAAARGRLPELEFSQSGWFLVRAVADNSDTQRFGMTGPYYVEIGDTPHISRRSAQFFLDWVYERAHTIRLENTKQRKEVLKYHRAAHKYWQHLVDTATVE